jgi:hypothetical protein
MKPKGPVWEPLTLCISANVNFWPKAVLHLGSRLKRTCPRHASAVTTPDGSARLTTTGLRTSARHRVPASAARRACRDMSAIRAAVGMNLRDAPPCSWSRRTAKDLGTNVPSDQRCLPCMQLITKAFAGEPPSSRSLFVKPRAFASETHRLKLSVIDSLASARDALAASVFFFCANTAVDVTTLIASAAVVAKISRIAFLPVSSMNQCVTILVSGMDQTLVHCAG